MVFTVAGDAVPRFEAIKTGVVEAAVAQDWKERITRLDPALDPVFCTILQMLFVSDRHSARSAPHGATRRRPTDGRPKLDLYANMAYRSDVSSELRRERIHLRLEADAKRKIERAAAISQETVSSFILSSALESAKSVIEKSENVVLSDPDWDAFFEALTDPPKPNETLLADLRWYRDLTS